MARVNPNLTIVCITKGDPFTWKYITYMKMLKDVLGAVFWVGLDSPDIPEFIEEDSDRLILLRSAGYIESVLDEVLQEVETEYIFRLDDDERVSHSLWNWLKEGHYTKEEIWTFPRCNMWDANLFINETPLFPDLQTRLTKKEFALGRKKLHEGCPYGQGKIAPYALIHDKFVVKSYQERKEIAEHYDTIQDGGGMGEVYKPFQLPEDVYTDARLYRVSDGYFPDWRTVVGKGDIWREVHF